MDVCGVRRRCGRPCRGSCPRGDPDKLDAVETVLADLQAQIADAFLGDRGVEALLPDPRAGLAALHLVPEANRNLVLRELATRIDLGQGLPMTLHLRLAGTSNDLKKIAPPNRSSGGRTQWCARRNAIRTLIIYLQVDEWNRFV